MSIERCFHPSQYLDKAANCINIVLNEYDVDACVYRTPRNFMLPGLQVPLNRSKTKRLAYANRVYEEVCRKTPMMTNEALAELYDSGSGIASLVDVAPFVRCCNVRYQLRPTYRVHCCIHQLDGYCSMYMHEVGEDGMAEVPSDGRAVMLHFPLTEGTSAERVHFINDKYREAKCRLAQMSEFEQEASHFGDGILDLVTFPELPVVISHLSTPDDVFECKSDVTYVKLCPDHPDYRYSKQYGNCCVLVY